MDQNQGAKGDLRSVIALCYHTLVEMRLPESRESLIESEVRLEELESALGTVLTRLQVATALGNGPVSALDVGSSPAAAAAVDRLLLALKNVVALRET